MSERNEQKKKQLFSVVRILVGVLAVLAVFIVLLVVLQRRIRTHSWWRQSSSTNLSGLEKAMQIYGNDFEGKLPSAEDANELKRIEADYRPAEDVQLLRREGIRQDKGARHE